MIAGESSISTSIFERDGFLLHDPFEAAFVERKRLHLNADLPQGCPFDVPKLNETPRSGRTAPLGWDNPGRDKKNIGKRAGIAGKTLQLLGNWFRDLAKNTLRKISR